MTRTICSGGLEVDERHIIDVLVSGLHGKPDPHFVGIDSDVIRRQLRPFLELHHRDHVRHPICERRMSRSPGHRVGEDGPPARHLLYDIDVGNLARPSMRG